MQRCVFCRSRRGLSQEYLLPKINVDTAENELRVNPNRVRALRVKLRVIRVTNLRVVRNKLRTRMRTPPGLLRLGGQMRCGEPERGCLASTTETRAPRSINRSRSRSSAKLGLVQNELRKNKCYISWQKLFIVSILHGFISGCNP